MNNTKTVAVIGIGNPLLTDDAVGLRIVERAARLLSRFDATVDFKTNSSTGLDLLFELAGYEKALLVDSVLTGDCPPGTVRRWSLQQLASMTVPQTVDSHGIDLPTLVQIGEKCGLEMPGQWFIIGVQARDVITISEQLTAEVSACIDQAVDLIEEVLVEWNVSENEGEQYERYRQRA